MTELQIANILQTSVVLALWLILVFKILPTRRVDSFRQKMFCVRDEVFDFAADGNISFDDPAYVLLRKQMNGFIRYGHQLTVFRMIMTMAINTVSGHGAKMSWNEDWESSLVKIQDDDVRAKMRGFHERGTTIAVKHLIWGSPLLWLAISLAVGVLIAHGAALGTRQLLRAAANKVFVGPLDQRLIEEAAVGALA
jgi:hypothetical protein